MIQNIKPFTTSYTQIFDFHSYRPSSVWNVMIDPVHGGAEDLILGVNPVKNNFTPITTHVILPSIFTNECHRIWYHYYDYKLGHNGSVDLRYSLDINRHKRSVSISKNSSSPAKEHFCEKNISKDLKRKDHLLYNDVIESKRGMLLISPATREKLEWTKVRAMSLQ